MVASMVFAGKVLGHDTCSQALKRLPPKNFPVKRSGQDMHPRRKRMLNYGCVYYNTRIRPHKSHSLHAVRSSTSSSNSTPSETVEQFYECINKKNATKLGKYLASDCVYEDLSFPNPFQGKKEVLNYFEQLMKCMGDNIEFSAEIVSVGDEGDGFIVAVNWHLEWNNILIPFTRGFSLFILSKGGEKLMIKKAQVIIEPPFKPGVLALNMLKIVMSLFDAFPEAAKWFLRSPHVILLKIYSLLAPFLRPLLACYINLWKFIALALSFAFNIYIQISKFFNK